MTPITPQLFKSGNSLELNLMFQANFEGYDFLLEQKRLKVPELKPKDGKKTGFDISPYSENWDKD